MLRDQHASPAPPHLPHRDQAKPQLEPEAVPAEAAGPAQRRRDDLAHLRRDEHGRAVAAERVGQVQIANGVQRGGDAGSPDQIDFLVATRAGGLGRALDVAQHHDPVVRSLAPARRVRDLGKIAAPGASPAKKVLTWVGSGLVACFHG